MDPANLIAELQKIANGGRPPSPPIDPPLNEGGGGGRYPDMEPRVAKLEAHMEHVRGDLAKLAGLPVELATVRTKVEHLPSKGFVVTAALSTIGGVVALFGLLQKIGLLH